MQQQNPYPIVEETLVVPHPATFEHIRQTERTPWMPSDDATQVKKSKEMSVMCCVAEIEVLDRYGEPISMMPAVIHKAWDVKKKKWQSDIACSELRPDRMMTERKSIGGNIPGLMDVRFGKAIAAYEAWLVKEGRDLPIVLLTDMVYPQAINMLIARNVKSIQALAALTDKELDDWRQHLLAHRFERMAGIVKKFREKAQERLARHGIGEAKPKKAA